MTKLAISLSAGFGLIAVVMFAAPSFADGYSGGGSIKINKDQLEKATWHKSRRQIQILDDGPQVNDLRTAPEQASTLNLYLSPKQAVPGKQYQYGDPSAGGASSGAIPVAGGYGGLPSAGFGSNIPANSHINPILPSGQAVPITGMERPTPALNGHRAVSGHMQPGGGTKQPVVPVQKYPTYTSSNGSSTGGSSIKAEAIGKLVRHPLMSKLSGN